MDMEHASTAAGLLLGVGMWMTVPSFLKMFTSSTALMFVIDIFFKTLPNFLSSAGESVRTTQGTGRSVCLTSARLVRALLLPSH